MSTISSIADATIGRLKKRMAQKRADSLLDSATYRIGDSYKDGGPTSIKLDVMRTALEAGANPNRESVATKKSLLSEAFLVQECMRLDYIKLLIAYGANPLGIASDACEIRGQAPIYDACRSGSSAEFLEMMKSPVLRTGEVFMLPRPSDSRNETWNLAMTASFFGDLSAECFQAIQDNFELHVLPQRPDLAINHLWTAVDDCGMNALMLARGRDSMVVTWLLDHPQLGMREHLEDRDSNGMTALCHAADKLAEDSVRKLLSYGADPMALDNNGNGILHGLKLVEKQEQTGNTTGRFFSTPIINLLRAHIAAIEAREAIDAVMDQATFLALEPAAQKTGLRTRI